MEGNGRSLYPGVDANRLMMMSELTRRGKLVNNFALCPNSTATTGARLKSPSKNSRLTVLGIFGTKLRKD